MLLDLYLPDRFGLDVLADLRTCRHPCDVIVITAAKEADAVRAALRQGVVDYVLKPFGFADLRERLQRYAAQRQLARPRPRSTARTTSTGASCGRAAAAGAMTLPKGMSAETAQLVEDALRSLR